MKKKPKTFLVHAYFLPLFHTFQVLSGMEPSAHFLVARSSTILHMLRILFLLISRDRETEFRILKSLCFSKPLLMKHSFLQISSPIGQF